MSYNTIKTAAMLASAAMAQEVQTVVNLTTFSQMQGKTYYVDYDKAIEFAWTGEYDPMAPDAHVKLLDSTFEPLPYTVTSNVEC